MKIRLVEYFEDDLEWERSLDDEASYKRGLDIEDLAQYINEEDNVMEEYLLNNYTRKDIIEFFMDNCAEEDEVLLSDSGNYIVTSVKGEEYITNWDEVIDNLLDSGFFDSTNRENAEYEYVENHMDGLEERRRESQNY